MTDEEVSALVRVCAVVVENGLERTAHLNPTPKDVFEWCGRALRKLAEMPDAVRALTEMVLVHENDGTEQHDEKCPCKK